MKRVKSFHPFTKITDLSEEDTLDLILFMDFATLFNLSISCKTFYQRIYKKKNFWLYVGILDLIQMCKSNIFVGENGKIHQVTSVCNELTYQNISSKQIQFGLSRISTLDTLKIDLPFLDNLFLLFPLQETQDIILPKLETITFLLDTLIEIETTISQLIRIGIYNLEKKDGNGGFPLNLSTIKFDLQLKMLDKNMKKANSGFKSKLKELVDVLAKLNKQRKRKINFNLNFCKNIDCECVIDTSNTCRKCSKLICPNCSKTKFRRCGICGSIHCFGCIETFCSKCPINYYLCKGCAQEEYSECFECEKKFCEIHEKCLTECYICQEDFCDSDTCIYQCDGCDKFCCHGEDCGFTSCQFCSRKFCKICVANGCFSKCEGCSCQTCEKCMFECKDCLAICCKWCNDAKTCCSDDNIYEL